MEVEAYAACGSPTLPEEAGFLAPVMIFGPEPQALPRPERVWPYETGTPTPNQMSQTAGAPIAAGEVGNAAAQEPPYRRRARRYNLNRQPTIEDYMSRRPTQSPEEHPSAPCRRGRSLSPPAHQAERPQQRVANEPVVEPGLRARLNGVIHPAPAQQHQARPQDALAEAARLVDGLRGLPHTTQDVVVQALADFLHRR